MMHRVVEAYISRGEVIRPILRFVVEALDNTHKRIEFSNRSASPIVWFREMAQVLFVVGTYLQKSCFQDSQEVYDNRYAAIRYICEAVTEVLNGDFLNLGILEFYKDESLEVIKLAIELALSVPCQQGQQYTKFLRSQFFFVEAVCHHYPHWVLASPPVALQTLLDYVLLGLNSSHPQNFVMSIGACNYLFTYMIAVQHGPSLVSSSSQAQRLDLELIRAHSSHPAMPHLVQSHLQQTQHVYDTLLQSVIKRAMSFPYADKASTASFISSIAILLPNFVDRIREHLLSQAQVSISLDLPDSRREDEQKVLSEQVSTLLEPLEKLCVLPDGQTVVGAARHTYRELFEQRMNDFCLRFVD
eukprot:TRINITY_DN3066_c0_g2_i8.p1 TRINITY_DN3066_c0_g2~~TRINITY_DN3066_c0_g2_i8.p1  ORF type:complete len:358 (+),score=44.74 TRINITY_DN3066_c0_g2_i8:187-1260(+)